MYTEFLDFHGDSVGKESAWNAGNHCKAGDPASIPGLGKSPGEGNGNLLQYSCLGNPTDRGTWQATVHVQLYSPRAIHDLVTKTVTI